VLADRRGFVARLFAAALLSDVLNHAPNFARECRKGICVKRDFFLYEALTPNLLHVARQFSLRVECYSIDGFFFEAFLLRNNPFRKPPKHSTTPSSRTWAYPPPRESLA
jgi:hypothetical protein